MKCKNIIIIFSRSLSICPFFAISSISFSPFGGHYPASRNPHKCFCVGVCGKECVLCPSEQVQFKSTCPMHLIGNQNVLWCKWRNPSPPPPVVLCFSGPKARQPLAPSAGDAGRCVTTTGPPPFGVGGAGSVAGAQHCRRPPLDDEGGHGSTPLHVAFFCPFSGFQLLLAYSPPIAVSYGGDWKCSFFLPEQKYQRISATTFPFCSPSPQT